MAGDMPHQGNMPRYLAQLMQLQAQPAQVANQAAHDIAGPSFAFTSGNTGSLGEAPPITDMSTKMTLGHQPGPAAEASLGKDAIGGIGAGVQGAGQAFQNIMQAVAKDQALKANERNSAADMQTVSRIADTKLSQNKLDFNSEMRQRGLSTLLRMLKEIQNMRSAGTKLQQDATDTATSSATAARRKR